MNWSLHLAQLALTVLAIPTVAACIYLALLTLLSARLAKRGPSSRFLRFEILIPAHNESAVIARCLASLKRLDWPSSQLRLTVVADNCDDDTADVARQAGARVLQRSDRLLRSKGYALAFGFAEVQRSGWADAVVVIDADSEVAPNLLEAFAARLETGAEAIQAHYGVLNADESWRTGLVAIAHGAFHGVRSRARERLGLSCGLRGNGWCISQLALRAVPYRAFSLTEDIEYGIALGLAGYRVHYADEGRVDAVMETHAVIASTQRQRWEGGRFALLRTQTLPLLSAALKRPSRVCLDLAADLLVLPLSYLVLQVITLITLAGLCAIWHPQLWPWLWTGLLCLVALVAYVLRGWQLSGRGIAGLRDLLFAPFFLIWRLGVRLRSRLNTNGIWVATLRRRP